MNRHPLFVIAAAFSLAGNMAYQAFSAEPAKPAPATVQLVTPNTSPPAKYKTYTYYGDRYRDPFISLASDVRPDQSSYERPPQIASLVLKGIVQDGKGRMALLTSGVSSYILRGGRLYNGSNKMVKKIAGVIKTDSVVIIADRMVRELKAKSPL
jgi:hypothetical protein